MGNQFNEIMQKLRAQRVRARRYTAMLLVLAMLTSLSVSWRLHQVGTALTTDNEYSCGMEEHVHTDDCYTEELVCGYEEGQPEEPDSAFSVDSEPTTEEPEEPEPEETEPEVHHHTADCYETVLVEHKELTCGEEEHTHDENCTIDDDGNFTCGYEEHTHTDDCYTTETETEEKLVCGYEEGEVLSDGTAADDGIAALEDTNTATSVAEDDSSSEAVSEPVLHHHTEACYEKVLTCTIPEHTHTLECLADYSADVETDDDWEKYSVGLSDNWNEALLAVAKEQLGYKESEKNFQTDEALGDIIDVHHYTRYGAFYGNPYADWDVAFIAFCQHYAGIPKTEIPQRLGLEALRADMDAMGFAYLTEGEDAAYEAIPGDVVTYNKNGTADDETIGIVETVGDDSLTVISGAVEGAVAEVTVPFTDVTSTILVDQAYGDYVGEADDRDGSHDDEIAVQPADEKDAAAVDASEGDIFNTDPPAVNLNDSTVQNNLGLTFTFQKRVGDDYVNANLGETIEEGDDVQVVVGFEAQAGTFKKEQNGNKAYYQLPYKLAEPLSNKDITDDSSHKIGRMDVNTDGLVVITFSDDVTGFDYRDHFKGTFKVWGKAFAKDDSTSDTITFPGHGNSFTLKKKSDISIHKDVDSKIIFEKGRTYFEYTITVSSNNGTAGETVTINDQITKLWNVKGQFVQVSFKLTKDGADAAIPVGYPKIETKSDGTSNFTIEGLEALQAGENYTLTYLYEITNANTLPKDGGNVTNSATASYGNNTTNPSGTRKQIMSPELSVKKEGVYGGNNPDTVMTGRVLWTITVDNPSGRDLNGFKVTDTVKTEGVIILDQNDVKGNIIQIKDGNNNKVDKIVNGKAENGEAKVSNDKRSFEYTFPANSTSTKYTFTYCTTVPLNHSAGSVQVSNRVDIDKGSEHYDDDESVNVSKREALLLKVPLGGTELEADNNRLKTVWELVIRSDASADTAKKFTIRDYFKNPTNQSNQTMDHYADKSKLEEELTAVGSENNEKGLFFDVLVNGAYRRVYGIEAMKALGADVTIQYYTDEDSKKEADENTDKVRSFTITVDWKGSTTPLSVVQIHAKGYTTYVDSADSLESGEKLSIYNYIKAGGKEQGAKSDYEKPTKKKPSLGKLVSASEWTGFKGSADIDYTGENTLIWYKLLLKNLDANEATVKDTLPAGLEYTGTYYVGWSTAETEGRNSTDKLLPFVTGGKNEGAENTQYLEEPTVTGTADTGQTLVFKLKNLNTLQNPKPGSYQIAIIFSVKVTDDYWNDISENPTKKYPNEAIWDQSSKTAKADAIVTRKNSYVEKRNDYRDGNKEVTYTVEINKEKKTLLSTAGKKLVLHDVLTVPSKISAEIDLQSIKLYNDAGSDVTTRMKCKPDEVVDDGTNKTYKITVEVPDGAHYTLTYTYKFIVPDNVADGTKFDIKNTVGMFGNSETPSELWYKHSGAAGSVTQDNTNTLKVYKVETDKFYNTLPGATFKLSQWNSSGWSEVGNDYTTDENGQILFRYANQVSGNVVKVERGVLYMLEETAPPSGYIGDSTPHYFLMLAANQTKEDAASTNVVQKSGVATSKITFVAANQTEQMYVGNTAKKITIRKVWQDANGKQETNVNHEPITVKLTRTDKATGLEDTSWSKEITLSSDNDWTYIYPDTSKTSAPDEPLEDGYTYAVKEENVPTGYNVSYTDQNGNERHTGFTSGDSVTITNMKETNWLIVEKKWLAEGGTTTLTDLPGGTSITLKLYKVDGTDPVQTKTLTKGDGNNWKWKVTNLDPSAKYYVVEEPTVKGFEVSYSHSVTRPASPGDTVIVTNTQKSTKTTLEVVKKWLNTDGMELEDNLPVGGIIVQLYKLNVETGKLEEVGGKTLPLNESNGWTGMFTDLEPDGQYTVKEVSVPDGYTVSYSVNEDEAVVPGATITVTNRKNAPGYELPATGSTGTAPYTTAGAVLMGAALVGGYRRKRRQERRGE